MSEQWLPSGSDQQDEAEAQEEAAIVNHPMYQALQRKLEASVVSHGHTIDAYTELRKHYDTLHRQYTELREKA
jgi:hypothetical protein